MVGLALAAAIVSVHYTPDPYGRHQGTGDLIACGVFALLLGGGFVCAGIAFLLDSMTIWTDKNTLTSRIRPIGFGAKLIDVTGAKQFFLGSRPKSCTLYVLDHDDHAIAITSLPTLIAAHQVRHELQDFFGLEDQDIYGQTTHPHHPGPRPK